MGKIKGFFGNVIKEMKKVRWPKRKETMHYAIWVFLCIVIDIRIVRLHYCWY